MPCPLGQLQLAHVSFFERIPQGAAASLLDRMAVEDQAVLYQRMTSAGQAMEQPFN